MEQLTRKRLENPPEFSFPSGAGNLLHEPPDLSLPFSFAA